MKGTALGEQVREECEAIWWWFWALFDCFGLEGAAWAVGSAIMPFLEHGFLIWRDGRVVASITAPVCGWPGQLHVLKFNIVASLALSVFLCIDVCMGGELLAALLASMGKKLNDVG